MENNLLMTVQKPVATSQEAALHMIANGKVKRIRDIKFEFKEPTPISDIIYLLSVGAEVTVHVD